MKEKQIGQNKTVYNPIKDGLDVTIRHKYTLIKTIIFAPKPEK